MNQQITSFNYLQRKVKSGGVIENLLSSYMPVYGGGYLLHSTTIEFIKHLVDDLQIACPIKSSPLSKSLASFEISDKICVFTLK